MRFNHVNLCASDVPTLTGVFEQHFGYRIVGQGTAPAFPGATSSGGAYAMLIGADGSNIVITEIAPDPDRESAYPRGFHIGLMQDTVDAVHRKHAELTAAGWHPDPIGASFDALGATWTSFYCSVGDGLEIEVNHRTNSEILDEPHRPADTDAPR